MTPLRQRMIEDMQVRNLAHNTQRSYLEQVSRFSRQKVSGTARPC
jgi:integrase/recombinase XerD